MVTACCGGAGRSARAPDVVQDQALAVVERHAHVPLLPRDAAAIDREAGPLGLHDVQRLEPCARRRRCAKRPRTSDKRPPAPPASFAVGLVKSHAAAALRVARPRPPYDQPHLNTTCPSYTTVRALRVNKLLGLRDDSKSARACAEADVLLEVRGGVVEGHGWDGLGRAVLHEGLRDAPRAHVLHGRQQASELITYHFGAWCTRPELSLSSEHPIFGAGAASTTCAKTI
jgi:hypothetical protein